MRPLLPRLILPLLAAAGLSLGGCSLTAPVEETPTDCELEFLTGSGATRGFNTTTASVGALLGQSFSLSADTEVSNVSVMLEKTGTPVGTITAEIYANSGGYPTGTALATSTALNTAVISSSAATEFTFNTSVTLTGGVLYWVVLEVTYDESDTNYITWVGSASDLHASGSAIRTDLADSFVDDTTVEDFTLAVECI